MTNQEAIEILEGLAVPIHAEAAFDMAVEALKKQEKDRWRSVAKEGTPKESGSYTCTFTDGKRLHVSTVRYAKRTGSWILTGQRAYWRVLAWKPLPEPYKEEDDDESGSD